MALSSFLNPDLVKSGDKEKCVPMQGESWRLGEGGATGPVLIAEYVPLLVLNDAILQAKASGVG